jgi:hypothetical protein
MKMMGGSKPRSDNSSLIQGLEAGVEFFEDRLASGASSNYRGDLREETTFFGFKFVEDKRSSSVALLAAKKIKVINGLIVILT